MEFSILLLLLLILVFAFAVGSWALGKRKTRDSRRPGWYEPEQVDPRGIKIGLEEQIARAEAELQRLDGLIAARRRQGPGHQGPGPVPG